MNIKLLRKKSLKFLLISIVLGFILFCFATMLISSFYKTPIRFVANELIRKSMLSGLNIVCQFYDPSPIMKANLGPDLTINDSDNNNYVRIEDFFQIENKQNLYCLEKHKNEKIISSHYDFAYQPYNEADLHTLRTNYKLDSLVACANDEFQAMVLLRNWARSKFRRNDYQPMMDRFNALTVLRNNIKNVDNKPYSTDCYRPCHFAPLLYSQLLISVGYQVRICTISFDKYYQGHGVVEVWSNQYNKWILMDADLNLYYVKAGVPLNLLELHNERYNDISDVKIIFGENLFNNDIQYLGTESRQDNNVKLENMINYASYFRINDMRNDWMTNRYFSGHPKRSDFSQLCWIDKSLPNIFQLNPATSNTDDFYWTLNHIEIYTPKSQNSSDEILLIFKTFTPNFDYFEIVLDDTIRLQNASDHFAWKLKRDSNSLNVVSVNRFGVRRVPNFLKVIKK